MNCLISAYINTFYVARFTLELCSFPTEFSENLSSLFFQKLLEILGVLFQLSLCNSKIDKIFSCTHKSKRIKSC